MTDHDVVREAIVDELRHAGYVEQYTNAEGDEAMCLTPEGEKVARQLSMLGEDGLDELMSELLPDVLRLG